MFELTQTWPRLDAELDRQGTTCACESIEGISLAAIDSQRSHQQAPFTLMGRVACHQFLDVSDHVTMPSGGQFRLEQIASRTLLQLFEPAPPPHHSRVVVELAQRKVTKSVDGLME